MNQIINFFDNLTRIQIMDIVIAIAIIMFFKIFSAGFSYIIIKMFKFKTKNSKKINHVGLYLKDNKFIHSTTQRGVIISSLYEEYYMKHYVASGRVIIY